MNLLPILFLLVSSTLVLRSGDRIIADGPIKEENGVVTFRAKGTLYSLPAIEIDRVEDASANAQLRKSRRRSSKCRKRIANASSPSWKQTTPAPSHRSNNAPSRCRRHRPPRSRKVPKKTNGRGAA